MPDQPQPHVTDHAIIRYLERVKGVDIEATRQEIADIVRRGVKLGAEAVVLQGMRYRLEGACCVTVIPARRQNHLPPMRETDE